ncbi:MULTISPECIES: helix-turn-helix domain-containing protein [unclassified Enterococcus]|uniref:winged helix-turn-helix transcriptional regulator n=1 Tax=unclassified Enterococcus TaxID=2608891 RepID=UPI001554CCCD|nr:MULTISPECIES: helix-turn-helix domain-containing protein [unclassified Enterococcus]MBS7576090.1 winged helix-turn-helix transcriptional regulator [Enterococcus sp. MMGLQ5-2]MBS7583323.1 winged helix-turn-helix transcriptional regulator [Enterococcus sp. MMGLQ5-1]NPD11183.1 winged helix-turn-helix transcriptional regulator [Enterococcus sp. MMGLQ5-1]NPD35926.1 winged helix-turn-helix transcriptional regulator [Enterococcus sp. MMGLQ5-2]
MIEKYNLAIEFTLKIIGGKWKPIILCHLGKSSLRTNELRKKIPNITQKMLTQQLRELEADHIIIRTVHEQVPPKVVYSLSEKGKSLKPILVSMSEWGEKRASEIKNEGTEIEIINNYDGFNHM